MRAPFQDGAFPAPVKYGYASVGVVEDGPAALRGRPVFCLHPHQTRYVVPADALYPLPDGLEPARAVLAANLETALNGLWDAAPRLGDRIAVIGGGTVGCLVAWLAARIPGCRVQLIDVNAQRERVASALGVPFALPAHADGEADRVVHASGVPDGLATALRLAGPEATVVELSWFGDREVALPLGGVAGRQPAAGAAAALDAPPPSGTRARAARGARARRADQRRERVRRAAHHDGAPRRRRRAVPPHRLCPRLRSRCTPSASAIT
jgi:hypothetical protein